jgi:hypothetical protein
MGHTEEAIPNIEARAEAEEEMGPVAAQVLTFSSTGKRQ